MLSISLNIQQTWTIIGALHDEDSALLRQSLIRCFPDDETHAFYTGNGTLMTSSDLKFTFTVVPELYLLKLNCGQ